MEAVYHAEGRVYNNGSALRYEYSIRDHLGNTRLTFTDKNANGVVDVTNTSANEILQENHFYPFGFDMAGPWMNDAVLDNQYKYNGKELNSDFGLNWMDYGARWYDASVGRWWGVDLMAEEFNSYNPYNYAINSPVMMVDLFGMESTFHDNGNMHLEGYDAQNYFRGLQSKERKSEMVSYSEDEDDSAIKKVKITITNQIVGKAHVSGFSHEKGRTKDIFEVPLYKLIIEGTDAEGIKRSEEYGVIRFGVQQRKTGGKATVVGRTKEESFTIRSWNPTYLSGLRGATPGAWRITGGFLLHDGADAPLKDAWGAIGCIEVCGSFNDDQDNFTRLNWLIRSWSGATEATKNTKAQYNKVATSGILIIYFQYSSKPPLKKI